MNSGVALTPPNSLHPLTADVIRLQGAQTVFVAGGPLAISDAVVEQLRNTPSYLCGGTIPRTDPLTGKVKTLNVIRIFGQTLYDTNERLAEFVGAEPPEALPELLSTNPYNSTSGSSSNNVAVSGAANVGLLVTGENFQDAIVGSVPAYGGGRSFNKCEENVGSVEAQDVTNCENSPMPLIATTPNTLSSTALNAMYNQHIGQVIVIGGPLAISDNVMNQLAAVGIRAVRVAGGDNTETSTQFAAMALSASNGLAWQNLDFDWGSYVNRTAGVIDQNDCNEDCVAAHVVLLTRGDYFTDGMAAAAVLSVHNGRWHFNDQKFPVIMSVNPTTLGTATTTFLNDAGVYVSRLTGAVPAGGYYPFDGIGDQWNIISSSVFTVQPIGGPVALTPALLASAVAAVTAG